MRLRGNSITASNVNSGIMNNNTNNHHDNNNGEERPSHFSNYYGSSKPPDVSSSSTPKRRTTGRRKSSLTAKLFSSSKPTNNNNHNESSQQQHNREMLFSADGMLPDPRCEMRAMIECQQQQQHQQRSEYYPQQQHLKPGVYAANNKNVSAAERFKYGDGHNNIPPNRAAEEVTEHHDTHHEDDDIIAVTNSANRFKFGIQQLQQQQYDIRRGSGGSVSTLTRSSAGEDTFHTPSPPGATAAATNRNLMIGKSPFANYKIDDNDDDNCDDHDDDSGGRQPYTRPSCLQYKRTTNMGLMSPAAAVATTTTTSSGSCSNMNNGYCAFDVNATRAELLSKLEGKRRGGGGGGATLKCSTVQEIDEDLLRERESTPSSSFFTQTQTSPPPEFRGSLRDCLIGMGFDDDAIIKAMVACNASESKDVENVIEWLDDHREVVGVGEGVVVRSSDDAYYHHHDINNNNNNKINHESFCDEESHYTQTSLHTRTSHGTAQTEESNEEIRILAHSLKDLGFDHVEIREKKELYRRASKNNGLLNAEGFIAAMFEVDDEIVGSSSSSSRVVKSRVKSEPLLARDDNDDDGNDWKRSASLSHHRKQRNQTDSELFSFLSAMGFSMEKIESAIQSLRNEGTNDIIDAEAVVAVLLSQQHEEKSRSSSVGALLPLVTIDNSHGGCSKSTADELEQNEFMKIEVTPGNFAPVLKARQTVQAISDGTAVSVRCTVCSVTLQCCPDAEYVLCPDCDVVSPILSQYRRLASSDRVAGSDGSSSQSSHHSARSNRRMSTGGMIGAIGLGKKSRR